MRAVLAVLLTLAVGVAGCSQKTAADEHLKQAGAEIKAAGTDLGKAVTTSAPDVKQAGAELGAGMKKAGDDIKSAGAKAGDDIKTSAHKAKDDAGG